MATKAERLEARLTATERRQIEQAAALAGESVSSFVVLAALDRAEILVREQASTVVPAVYFDELVASLDEPEEAPRLAQAARKARRSRRIKPA
ncbi:MAG: type II toxin-antitoxin system TacA family antitoxin [Solirubrobacteraceae bacterium]